MQAEHKPDCEVVKQRVYLEADLEKDPTNPYLLGARVEYYEGGDQEVECCTCSAADEYFLVGLS